MKDKFLLKIRDSFWFVPFLYGISAIILVYLTIYIDAFVIHHFKQAIPNVLLTSKDVAIELYASLVTAGLTMTTISFSVIMVVLTTYSMQFSPRTLQDFMHHQTTQHVLGVYSFSFIFALLNLLMVGKADLLLGPIIMVIIAIIDLAFFISFIHHSARWIQVNNLIASIRDDGTKIIKRSDKEVDFVESEEWNEEEINGLGKLQITKIPTLKSGYVQKIDWDGLVRWAMKHECVIRVHVHVGDFVSQEYVQMSVYMNKSIDTFQMLEEMVIVGNERTDLQDIEFILQKMVEIALRAISPAVNDPHTAINCINRIGALLIDIGESYKETKFIADNNNRLRVIKKTKTYQNYLYKSFYQIRHYGKEDISIVYSMIEILFKIAIVSDDRIKKEIWKFHGYIMDIIDWESLSELDYYHLKQIYDKLVACCSGYEHTK